MHHDGIQLFLVDLMQSLPDMCVDLMLSLQHIKVEVSLKFDPKVFATEVVPGFVTDVVANSITHSLMREETVVLSEHTEEVACNPMLSTFYRYLLVNSLPFAIQGFVTYTECLVAKRGFLQTGIW